MSPTEILAGATPPPGLPDTATLARMAAEFFAALPAAASAPALGGVPLPSNPQPPGLTLPPGAFGPSTPSAYPAGTLPPGANLAPSSPQTAADAFASAPALAPHAQAPNGVPDHALQAAPGYDGRLGGHVLGVPEALAVNAPALALPSTPAPGAAAPDAPPSGYYFIDELGPLAARAASGAAPAGLDAAAPAPPHAQPSATAFYFVDPSAASTVPTVPGAAHPPFDVHAVRRDFPILAERVNGRTLVWFDNAATTQKPQAVIDRLAHFYRHENSNIHRGAHELAARATDAYENARETVRRFLGAAAVEEIVFVRGTTEAINLVAQSWGGRNVGAGDEIVVSHLEHHANIVPWQQLAAAKGARLRVIPVDDSGQVILSAYEDLLNERTKIVAVTQVSNALGTVVPVQSIVEAARRRGIATLVDGAQSVAHMRVDMRALGADFFVFSGHKIFGPTGIGALYGRREVLEQMPPWQGGGNMIADVTFEKTLYQEPPARFEAGTGNIADAAGLGTALEYVERVGIDAIGRYEHELLDYASAQLARIAGLRLVGTARDKASVLSFVLDGSTTDEVGKALNAEGIAVRTGHHCAQPILRRFGVEATVRASLAFYNTGDEVDRMVAVLRGLVARARQR